MANRYSAQFEYTTAESWLKKAAQRGDPECLAALGTYYMTDRYDMPSKVKIAKNSTNAVFLFSLAAHQGYKPAQHDLAIRCFDGTGTKRDVVRAYQMFRLSDIPPFSQIKCESIGNDGATVRFQGKTNTLAIQ